MQGKPGRAPAAAEAVRRFLHFYGPATSADFAAWAGRRQAARRAALGARSRTSSTRSRSGERSAWVLRDDCSALDSPPAASGIRLIPPGDPYLQKPNRALLAPDAELRKRLFRPVASPGAVLKDGRLVGLWRVKAKGRKAEITVERLGRIARKDRRGGGAAHRRPARRLRGDPRRRLRRRKPRSEVRGPGGDARAAKSYPGTNPGVSG